MTPYRLKIVTPDKLLYDGDTEQIIVRTTEGNVGILANHTNNVANLPAGALKVKINGEMRTAAISGGSIGVNNNSVTILAISAEWEDEIDLSRAKAAEQRARNTLNAYQSGKEFEKASFQLKRALNRINIVEK